MPDVVPNELNYETLLDMGAAAIGQAGISIVKLDFPLLVTPKGNQRVVNVITDVEYDFPPDIVEMEEVAAKLHAITANGYVERTWDMGLFKQEPATSQLINGTGSENMVTKGNPNVYDIHHFIECLISDGAVAAGLAMQSYGGTNLVKQNMQYMGIGTVVPQSYVWLAVGHRRAVTGTGATNWAANTLIKAGVRVKYIQTTLPLQEWVGLYFSAEQLGDQLA